MQNQLMDYVNGKINYVHQMSIVLNDRKKDWYSELGKYIVDLYGVNNLPGSLSIYAKHMSNVSVIKKVKQFVKSNSAYSGVSMLFITDILNSDSLRKMFGEPLYHDEFGEGFDGEYDEETDTSADPNIKESYASYFVNVGGVNLHIGYDHRGTCIEVENGTTAPKFYDVLCKLVDLYKDKVG